jgi:multidrug efflux system membrane fusion protein
MNIRSERTLVLTTVAALAALAGVLLPISKLADKTINPPGKTAQHHSETKRRQAILTLDPRAQSRIGLKTEVLAARTFRAELVAYGLLQEDPAETFVVRAPLAGTLKPANAHPWPHLGERISDEVVAGEISPRVAPVERVGLESQLARAESEVTSATASADAARAAFDRAKILNADNKNVSDRDLQAAEATFKGEEARLKAAKENVSLVRSSLAASSGPTAPMPLRVEHGGQVVEVLAQPGETVASGQPLFRIVRYDQLLAKVDLPAGQQISGLVSSARIVPADYENRSLRGMVIAQTAVDPKLQGQSFIIRVHVDGLALRPGTAVAAYFAVPGPTKRGVIVPHSAVVFDQGKSWAYVQLGRTRFARREIGLEEQAGQGWFSTDFAAGDRIVVRGAQMLLSEELKSQIQASD